MSPPITGGRLAMIPNRKLTPEQALQKARHYCGYQERTHAEVKEKLYGYGLRKDEVESLLAQLIEEDYLNEARFASAFAGGKFRMKQWGRVKIKYELKQKKISEYNIKKALKEIDEEDYQKMFNKLFKEKFSSLSHEKNMFTKKRKVLDYLLQKGFEREMIMQKLNTVEN